MTLPANGSISLGQTSVELNAAGNSRRSLNDGSVRTLYGVPGGTISLNNGHGRSNIFTATASGNWVQTDLGTIARSIGWNGSSKLNITIGAGSTIISNDVNSYALFVSGSFPNGIILTNNGYIIGKGGHGAGSGWGAQVGGPAFSTDQAITIINNGVIAGGGNGGAAGGQGDGGTGGYGGGGGGAGYGPRGVGGAEGGVTHVTASGDGSLLAGGPGGAGGWYGGYGNDRYGYGGANGGALGGGPAVAGNGYISWGNLGDVRGARN